MSKKTYQRYSVEFKEQALALLATGKPVAEVATDLCVSTSLLYEWRSRAHGPQGGSAGQAAAGGLTEADALRALRRENARLQTGNDILKKAQRELAGSFMQDSDQVCRGRRGRACGRS